MTTYMSRADFPSSEGAVQGWWSGVDQLGSFLFKQNFQVDGKGGLKGEFRNKLPCPSFVNLPRINCGDTVPTI